MKYWLALLICLTAAAHATAEPSLASMLGEASRCSDAVLNAASDFCDPPERMAAMAIAKCQSKWNLVAETAIGPPSRHASSASERHRTLKRYSEALEFEYIRDAELKVIDRQKASARCGFD